VDGIALVGDDDGERQVREVVVYAELELEEAAYLLDKLDELRVAKKRQLVEGIGELQLDVPCSFVCVRTRRPVHSVRRRAKGFESKRMERQNSENENEDCGETY
jgi:hypothetical protein